MNASLQEVRARNLRTVALLAALFLLPLLMAFAVYYGASWRPALRTNHGALILPARDLPRAGAAYAKTFTHAWSLVYVGASACDESCQNALYVMRQTHLGLNNDMERVQRVFVATGDAGAQEELLAREYPGLVVIHARRRDGEELVRQFPADERVDAIFIVDPLGNLMMRFDSRANPKGLREDLTKLLKLSHVG